MWAPPVHEIAAVAPVFSYVTEYISQPLFPQSPLPVPQDSSPAHWTNYAIPGVWLCGFAALTLMRFNGVGGVSGSWSGQAPL